MSMNARHSRELAGLLNLCDDQARIPILLACVHELVELSQSVVILVRVQKNENQSQSPTSVKSNLTLCNILLTSVKLTHSWNALTTPS